jgi:hypothetical protein
MKWCTGQGGSLLMSADPLPIVEEFLESETPQLRKNAVTALAALGTDASIERLIRATLDERDPGVRQRCEEEIRGLTGAAAGRALAQLGKALKDRRRRTAAYALLGELRNRGMAVPAPDLSLAERLWLAFSLRRQLYPTWSWQVVRRTFGPALLGALVAFGAFCLYYVLALRSLFTYADGALAAVGVLALSPLLAALVSLYTSPFGMHLDRRAAVVTDLLSVLILSAFGVLVVSLLDLTTGGGQGTNWFALGLPALVVAVRGGTLLAYRNPGRHRQGLAALVGCAAGVLAYCGALAAVGVTEDGLGGSVGLCVLLSSAGIANGFASIDATGTPLPPVGRRVAWLLCAPPVVAAALLALLAAVPFRPLHLSRPGLTLMDPAGDKGGEDPVGGKGYGDTARQIPLGWTPWELGVKIPGEQQAELQGKQQAELQVNVLDNRMSGYVVLSLKHDGKTIVSRSLPPGSRFSPGLDQMLSVGRDDTYYTLVAKVFDARPSDKDLRQAAQPGDKKRTLSQAPQLSETLSALKVQFVRNVRNPDADDQWYGLNLGVSLSKVPVAAR